MHSLQEAFVRERMHDEQRRSREATLARELSAQRRWQRVLRYARSAEGRHARSAASAASAASADWALAR